MRYWLWQPKHSHKLFTVSSGLLQLCSVNMQLYELSGSILQPRADYAGRIAPLCRGVVDFARPLPESVSPQQDVCICSCGFLAPPGFWSPFGTPRINRPVHLNAHRKIWPNISYRQLFAQAAISPSGLRTRSRLCRRTCAVAIGVESLGGSVKTAASASAAAALASSASVNRRLAYSSVRRPASVRTTFFEKRHRSKSWTPSSRSSSLMCTVTVD